MRQLLKIAAGVMLASGFLAFSMTAMGADKAKRVGVKKPAALSVKGQAVPEIYTVYVGTYTGQDSKGIYVCRFNTRTGEITGADVAAEVKNPSFLAIHPNHKFLYAVSESGDSDGKNSGAVERVFHRPGFEKAYAAQQTVVRRGWAVPPGRRCERPECFGRELRQRQHRLFAHR